MLRKPLPQALPAESKNIFLRDDCSMIARDGTPSTSMMHASCSASFSPGKSGYLHGRKMVQGLASKAKSPEPLRLNARECAWMDARMRWGVCEGAHLPGIKLCEDAAEGPNVDAHVVREAEDHLRDAPNGATASVS
jgi:hypothetical protein